MKTRILLRRALNISLLAWTWVIVRFIALSWDPLGTSVVPTRPSMHNGIHAPVTSPASSQSEVTILQYCIHNPTSMVTSLSRVSAYGLGRHHREDRREKHEPARVTNACIDHVPLLYK